MKIDQLIEEGKAIPYKDDDYFTKVDADKVVAWSYKVRVLLTNEFKDYEFTKDAMNVDLLKTGHDEWLLNFYLGILLVAKDIEFGL